MRATTGPVTYALAADSGGAATQISSCSTTSSEEANIAADQARTAAASVLSITLPWTPLSAVRALSRLYAPPADWIATKISGQAIRAATDVAPAAGMITPSTT